MGLEEDHDPQGESESGTLDGPGELGPKGGIKEWMLSTYGEYGVVVSSESETAVTFAFPKTFDGFSDVVIEANAMFGSVCDLTYTSNGEPEVKFWKAAANDAPDFNCKVFRGLLYIFGFVSLAVAVVNVCPWPSMGL